MRVFLSLGLLIQVSGQFHPLYRANLGDPMVRVKLLKNPAPDNRNVQLKGILAFPNFPGPFPAVVIVHDRFGRDSWADSRALYFARQGMVGFAVDYMGTNFQRHNQSQEADEHAERLLTGGQVQVRLQAALLKLRAMPFVDTNKIGVLCLDTGSLGCLGLGAKDPVRGIVLNQPDLRLPYHLDLPTDTTVMTLTSLNDLNLRMLSEKLTEGGLDWELHLFGPMGNHSHHLPSLHSRAWTMSLLFFSDVMSQPT